MGRASLWRQLQALVKRNIIIKSRNTGQVLAEVLYPIYFVLILAMIKHFVQPSIESAIPLFPKTPVSVDVPSGQLYVSPNSSAVGQLMERVTAKLESGGPLGYVLFGSADEAVEMYRYNDGHNVSAGINFADGTLQNLTYMIRMNFYNIASTDVAAVYSSEDSCRGKIRNCAADSYLKHGFVALQMSIDAALIELHTGVKNVGQIVATTRKYPKGKWMSDFRFIQYFASIYLVMAFTPFVSFLTVSVVAEKEKKIKETLRMVGMRDSAYWLSWGVTYLALLLIVIVFTVAITGASRLFSVASLPIFFLLLLLYGLSVITMSFVVTPFFCKAQVAGTVASLATFLFSLLYLAVAFTRTIGATGMPESSVPVLGQVFMCLLSPVALAMAIDQGIYLDITYGGMTHDRLGMGQVPICILIVMLFLDFILYAMLAVYFDNIVPGEFGQKRSPCYFLSPNYWRRKKLKLPVSGGETEDVSEPLKNQNIGSELVEDMAEEFQGKEVIRMYNLRKVFSSGEKKVVAVDGFCMDIYEDQITALLGHNGAGKTTLMNILTGLVSATSGTATIYGLDVSDANDQEQIRAMTGVCPQQNVLFDDLTSREHLMFYANLKGVAKDVLVEHVEETLRDADLLEVTHTQGKQLSGGQKRKLCVALTLIGDPKIVFMDEPTAGMDPYSRRHLWSLLKKRRAGRVILLTTHFMDEADILTDRKAFISKGKLQCVGSSLFLKNRFGVGYHLGMVIDPTADVDAITRLVQEHVAEAVIDRSHCSELTYTLPVTAVINFADMFQQLDGSDEAGANTLGIKSYGVSMTTLEEVFLKIGIEETEDIESPDKEPAPAITDPQQAESDAAMKIVPPQGEGRSKCRTLRRFWALCIVRWIILKRSKTLIFARFGLPLITIVAAVFISRRIGKELVDTHADPNALRIHPMLYSKVLDVEPSHGNPNMTYIPAPLGGPGVSDFVDNLYSQMIGLTEYFYTVDYLAVAPHHMGLDIHNVDVQTKDVSLNVTAMYNDSATHSLPATVNVISNTVLRMLNSSAGPISVVSKPWPDLAVDLAKFQRGTFSSVMMLGFGLSMVPATFAVTVVKDKQMKIRSQLRISSVSHTVYWLSTFFADFLQYLVAMILAVVIFVVAQVETLQSSGAVITVIILYLVYMVSTMLLAYDMSFFFHNFETAQTILTNLFVTVSILPFLPVSMLDMFGYESIATDIHNMCVIFVPPYALFGGLYYISKVYNVAMVDQGGTPNVPMSSYFEWDSNIPICLIAPVFHSLIFVFFLRLIEIMATGGSIADACCVGSLCKKISGNVLPDIHEEGIIEGEDSDVLAERDRVNNWDLSDKAKAPVVLVRNLLKEFPKSSDMCKRPSSEVKVAVCNVSFAVEGGEVFGLLGPNGAGKTTTLNMIIAEEGATRGEVYVAGHDVRSSLSSAFEHMGYCPQHNALWEEVTLEEHLRCYAALQGYSSSGISTVVKHLLKSLHVEDHQSKIVKNLSGGTKRKLSYAISMLGYPRAVLMDEPSTGIDPRSKRFLWGTISRSFQSTSQGAILTTHYMEEAEALCNRIAIMVNGRMQCVGTLQHLKSKFGQGYLLEVKLGSGGSQEGATDAENFQALGAYIKNIFPIAFEVERFGKRVTYRIPQGGVNSLSQTFNALEEGKKLLGIVDYSFSQSTLEQVFIEFAKSQYDEESGDTQALVQQLSTVYLDEKDKVEDDTHV